MYIFLYVLKNIRSFHIDDNSIYILIYESINVSAWIMFLEVSTFPRVFLVYANSQIPNSRLSNPIKVKDRS